MDKRNSNQQPQKQDGQELKPEGQGIRADWVIACICYSVVDYIAPSPGLRDRVKSSRLHLGTLPRGEALGVLG